MIESVAGIIVAAPTPCTTRKTMSCSMLCASPHAIDAVTKMTSPARYTRRRPKRSPILPAAIGSTAVARTYPLTVHSADARLAFRSLPMAGKATFTTNVSIMSMPSPRQAATSTSHLLRG